ncbi:alpha/beta hydrolase [Piscinibacter sp.]|uniref:alpha/beta hydrolase n=1 Tax=Piscinibacter sp. TaxID=1903157 RepID=UPI002B648D27|nr:alpha/beta hydrolase [Albitalea sp.]HUG21459.1 alpha/beta hydrolase [Albitalea sp.]
MARMDSAWLDLQYNNRARIPEHPQIFERWAKASALAREGRSEGLDLAYGDGPNEVLDVFPARQAGAPVLVFIHGGWWRALDKRDHSFVAPAFVETGAMVVVPNYALCPAVTIEEIALQMARALAWIWRHAARYGGDPDRIVVAGHSAGGHLAAMMLSCRWREVAADLPQQLVRKALSISGVFDLEPLRHTPFLQADLRLTAESVRRLSPARFPPPAGELHATVGANESEEFLRQNRLIRQAWGHEAVPVCEAIPRTHHLNVLHELVDPHARLHTLAKDLLGLSSSRLS